MKDALTVLAAVLAGATMGACASPPPSIDPVPHGTQIELAWKFAQGQVLRYQLTCQIEGGEEARQAESTTLWCGLEVLEIAATGTAIIDVSIERVRVSARDGAVEAGFDSDVASEATGREEAAGAMREAIDGARAIVGRVARLRVSPRGEMLEVWLRRVASDGRRGNVRDDEWLAEMLRSSFPALPPRPVAAGEEWRWSYSAQAGSAPGRLRTVVDARLEGIRDGGRQALIHGRLDVEREGQSGLSGTVGRGSSDTVWAVPQGRLETHRQVYRVAARAEPASGLIVTRIVKRLAAPESK